MDILEREVFASIIKDIEQEVGKHFDDKHETFADLIFELRDASNNLSMQLAFPADFVDNDKFNKQTLNLVILSLTALMKRNIAKL